MGYPRKAVLTETHKSCNRCGETKTHADFHVQKAGLGGLHLWCKMCCNAYHREWRAKPENKAREQSKYRRHDLKRDFGITVEEYDHLLAAQGGVCAICRQPCKSGRRLAVDHDHRSSAIRALLCSNCNRGLGCFQDDPALLEAAIGYLRAAKEVSPPHRVHVAA